MSNIQQQNVTYRAAAYTRLSKEDRDSSRGRREESNSIASQKQLIFDFAKNRPEINIISKSYDDDGYTGTNYDRPAFQSMLSDIQAGLINCVIVKDLSRFGREYIDAGKYIDRLFPVYGVRLIAINDGIDTFTKDPSASFNISIRNLFNDNYCRDISIKVRTNLETKRQNGEFIGPFVTYGYMRSQSEHNHLIVDEYPASIVIEIFKWKLQGMSQDTIAKKLNELGVLSPMEYKRSMGMNYQSGFRLKEKSLWTPVAVRRILTNSIYVGTLTQGIRTTPSHKLKMVKVKPQEDWCVLHNNHEPLVSQKVFDLVQRLLLLDTRTSPNEEKVFSLAGLMVCGDCGCPMVKKLTTSGKRKYAYYICSKNKQTKECSSHRIKAEKIEETVLTVIQKHIELILELQQCLAIIDQHPYRRFNLKKSEQQLVKLDEEISRYRKLKISVYEDMKDGIVSKTDYLDITERYEERIRSAEASKREVRREMEKLLSDSSEQQEWMKDFIAYRNLKELTRIAAVQLIDCIQIYEGSKVSVTFLHSQDFELLRQHLAEFQQAVKAEEAM